MPQYSPFDESSQLKLNSRYHHPPDTVLKVVEKRSGPVHYFYCIFVDSPRDTLLENVSSTAYRAFNRMARTMYTNGASVANMHVDTLCAQLNVAHSTLYNALSELIRGDLAKKWKQGKYLLNPYCVYVFYHERKVKACRELWDTWETLTQKQRDATLVTIMQRGKE